VGAGKIPDVAVKAFQVTAEHLLLLVEAAVARARWADASACRSSARRSCRHRLLTLLFGFLALHHGLTPGFFGRIADR